MELNKDLRFKLDVVGSLSSIVALVITLISLAVVIFRLPYSDLTWVVITYALSNIFLMFFFITLNFHVNRRLFAISEISTENYKLNLSMKEKEVEIKNTPETLSSLIYYNELFWLKMNDISAEILAEKDADAGFNKLCMEFETYLHSFTSCLQSYFSQMTGEKCSVTVKLTKPINGVNYVKTLYRDPMSLQKRQENDRKHDGKPIIYRVDDNSGFKAIINDKLPNVGFYCDKLSNLEYYHNANSRWKQFYNATAIEPITIKKQKFLVQGFLCVDNFRGNLSRESLKSVLEANAIQLYSIIDKFNKICEIEKLKTINHGLKCKFTDWDIS